MTDLFLDILNASYAASFVVLAVILARLALKKAPRWMVCALWVLVAVRLLVPGVLETSFSLVPSTEIIPPQSLYDTAPQIQSGFTAIDDVVNPVYSESLQPAPGASVNPLQVWLAIFANVWFLGAVAMAIWALVSCIRVRRQLRERVRVKGNIFLCDGIESPFIFGLFRPMICLPGDLGEAASRHVIAHERAHLRRRDHWWKPLGFALLTVNWFNPLMWVSYILLCRDIEMACDERVVRDLSPGEKKAYSAALLACSVNPRHITACPLAFGEVGVKQRIKSVLSYKKPAFWVILVTVIVGIALAAGLLTNPKSGDPEIRWDNILYIQEGKVLRERPAEAVAVGTLKNIVNVEVGEPEYYHPDENGEAAHLNIAYIGSPIWMAGDTLYLMEPDGERWLPFIPRHTPGDLWTMMGDDDQCRLNLRGSQVSLKEWLEDEDKDALLDCLKVSMDRFQPTMDWNYSMLGSSYNGEACIIIDKKDFTEHCLLLRRENDWLIVYRDAHLAVSAWTIESPELDAFLAPWQNELAYSAVLFDPYATETAPVYLEYQTIQMEDIALRCAYPGNGAIWTGTHWESQTSVAFLDRQIQLRLRPVGRERCMTIRYDEQEEPAYKLDPDLLPETMTFANEITGTLYHPGDPGQWELIVLDTAHGQLFVTLNNADWSAEDRQMALTILGTLQLTKDGIPILGKSYRFNVPQANLGITLHMENVTPRGATLVVEQDGTLWDEIITGSNWMLEQKVDGQWVSIMPESTVWTTEAYLLTAGSTRSFPINWGSLVGELGPGEYRVGKHFTGERRPMFTLAIEKETQEQMVWAEFTIE